MTTTVLQRRDLGARSTIAALFSALMITVLASASLVGCSSTESRTLGFGTSDIEYIAVYQYAFAYGDDVTVVTRAIVDDRREIESIVQSFTDIAVFDGDDVNMDVIGAQASGLRILLKDGSAFELTQVFIGPQDIVLFWPDSAPVRTRDGSPISTMTTPASPSLNEVVDPDERPTVLSP